MYFSKKKFNFLNILPWLKLETEIKNFDIIINATSLGLKDGEDFNFEFLIPRIILFILIQFIIH